MSVTESAGPVVEAGRGRALGVSLRRAERTQRVRALLLVLPAIGFLVVAFVVPILSMLVVAVQNPELREVMPRTAAAMMAWDGIGVPPPATIAVFVGELRQATADGSIGKVARRLNYSIPGFRSVLLRTGRSLPPSETPEADLLAALAGIDPHWAEPPYWLTLKGAAPAVTDFYLLAAADRRRDARGAIVTAPPDQAVFVTVFARTFWVSLVVTAACLLLGYPIAHLLASLPPRRGNVLMILVLLPFWTSVLVRTTAWLVLLQREGVVNDLAVRLGITTTRIELVHNRFGVYVAMVHILLPFMVLPIWAVMRRIDPEYGRAAANLGASPARAFVRVFVPLTMSGVLAGCLLVFVLALGFYITPALLGGLKDQMISQLIVQQVQQRLDWGFATAMSVLLMLLTFVILLIASRAVRLRDVFGSAVEE
jgi:putative spermidine/putrescine transport system permease protein